MTKKYIKELVEKSYTTDGLLDEEITTFLAQKLSRADLKKYINAIQLKERKTTVIIKTSSDLSQKELDEFKKEYADKKIEYKKDESLLLGVEIIDNDMIYNKSLKNRLEGVMSSISQQS